MGKHKNNLQEDALIHFMENHPDIARGFTRGDKADVKNLWRDLTTDLNSLGPPTRDTNGWKKVWRDWKTSIKKKISTNKKEAVSTGGGPYNQIYISKKEELIGQISGIYSLVEGIEKAVPIIGKDLPSEDLADLDEGSLTPAKDSTCKRKISEAMSDDIPSTSKRSAKEFLRKNEDIKENLKLYMNESLKKGQELSESMKIAVDIFKKNDEKLDVMSSNIRRVYKAIESLTTNITTEIKRHNLEMEKSAYEKNAIKKKELEIKEKQLELKLIKYQ